MTQTATKTQKTVQVIARYTLKRNGHVIYAVRSSNGVDQYQVLVIGGVVESCSCPAHGHCYHKRGIQIIEENRREAKQQVEKPAVATEERHRVSCVHGVAGARWYPEYRDGAEWYRFPQVDGNRAVSFVIEGRAEAWLADRLAEVEGSKAESKMFAWKRAMDEQYASDPCTELARQREAEETAASYMRHLYDEY